MQNAPRRPRVTSDDIRAYVVDRYVRPARDAGDASFTVRAGDLMAALPGITGVNAPCSALRARKFAADNGLELVEERGPRVGYNTELTFQLVDTAPAGPSDTAGAARVDASPAAALVALYGSAADVYAAHGGGEAVLAAVREGWE